MDEIYTDLEKLVIDWLTRHNIEYKFSSSIAGGHYSLGGAVVDFLLPNRGLAWRVHGEYWHTGIEIEGHDATQRELLTGLGWHIVDLWQDDLENRLEETMRKALLGEEMLRG